MPTNNMKKIKINEASLVSVYEKGTMFRMPRGTAHDGWVFFHPNSLIHDAVQVKPQANSAKKTLVVNCWAGPGAGKTTAALEITAKLKKLGINADYVQEFAKELVYAGRLEELAIQEIVSHEQMRRLSALIGKVDVVVTDSPILLGEVYGKNNSPAFSEELRAAHFAQDSFNIFINRGQDYDQSGRIENETEAKAKDEAIKQLLKNNKIFYGTYGHGAIDLVVTNIKKNFETINNAPAVEVQEERYKELSYQEGHAFTLRQQGGTEITLTGEELTAELAQAAPVIKFENKKLYLQNCPDFLKTNGKFVCEKLTWNQEKGKFDKLPIDPHTGRAGKVNDPATWGTFAEACAAVDKYRLDGIGFILTGEDKITGIDLDMVPKSHNLSEGGQAILESLRGKTYIEYSASGAIHAFGFAEKPVGANRGNVDNCLEMYGGLTEGNKAIMLTGDVFGGELIQIQEIQKDIDEIHAQFFKKEETVIERPVYAPIKNAQGESIEDRIKKYPDDWGRFQDGMSGNVSKFGGDYSAADIAFCGLLALYTSDANEIDSLYRQTTLYSAVKDVDGHRESRAKKWDSKRGGSTYGADTINKALSHAITHDKGAGSGFGSLQEIEHLRIYAKTDKAVLTKPDKDKVWLPLSRIELDKYGKNVVKADGKLMTQYGLKKFIPVSPQNGIKK